MNDLINRHGVAAWLENMGHKKLANYIMDENRFPSESSEPAIEPEPQWIPCSEKLPELGVRVLISDDERVEVAQLGNWPHVGYTWEFDIYGNDLKDWPYWMPAPEPPKGGKR